MIEDLDAYCQEREYRRRRLVRAVRGYFYRERRVRLVFVLMLLLSTATSLVMSPVLLRLGVHSMIARWPLAVICGGVMMLALSRWWTRREYARFAATPEARRYLDADLLEESREWDETEKEHEIMRKIMDGSRHGNSGGPLALVAIVFGWIVWQIGNEFYKAGPTLLAEIFIDGELYERVPALARKMPMQEWLATAFEMLLPRVAIIAVFSALVALLIVPFAPEAGSIREIWRKYHPVAAKPSAS